MKDYSNTLFSIIFVSQEVPDYAAKLVPVEALDSKPLKGIKIGVIRETMGDGVDSGVISSIQTSALRLKELGAALTEVLCFHPN